MASTPDRRFKMEYQNTEDFIASDVAHVVGIT